MTVLTRTFRNLLTLVAKSLFFLGFVGAVVAQTQVAGSNCSTPPRIDCPEANCPREAVASPGAAVEPESGRQFFLDFPCDLQEGEPLTFILNLHGAGSIANWQRHYFPVVDHKETYRLVIATPSAATDNPPPRRWTAEADDAFLQAVSELVFNEFGRENIARFWLAGHSQGGLTSRRIVCSDYFGSRVDGFVSLSGGRSGSPPREGQSAEEFDCDFSYIFTAGILESQAQNLPETSSIASRFGCDARVRHDDIVDTVAGYVTATDQSRGPSWGTFARPGTAEFYEFPGCDNGRVVADIIRLDKGHTEGLEPNAVKQIIELMLAASGGKAR